MKKDDILYDIIDRLGRTQDDMRDLLVEIKTDLRYHIRRTDILEEQVNAPFPWKKVSVIVSMLGVVAGFVLKIIIQ
jgi:hypothetical protein